jgi:hypothetical protein
MKYDSRLIEWHHMTSIMDGNICEVASAKVFAACGTHFACYPAIERTVVNKRGPNKLCLSE